MSRVYPPHSRRPPWPSGVCSRVSQGFKKYKKIHKLLKVLNVYFVKKIFQARFLLQPVRIELKCWLNKHTVSFCTRSISLRCLCSSTLSSSESVDMGVGTTTSPLSSLTYLHPEKGLSVKLPLYSYFQKPYYSHKLWVQYVRVKTDEYVIMWL